MSSRFTDAELKAALEKTGGNMTDAASILGVARSTVTRARDRLPDAARSPSGEGSDQTVKVSKASGGFDLKGRPLMAKKPTDVWGPRFNALRLETGYLPDVLASQWGASVETVRKKARDAGAVRYTEQDGQYIEVIVHPKTRGGK